MVGDLGAPVGAGVYNVYTGELGGTAMPTAAQLGLEPPRFCAQCGRRMVVQVRPDGWRELMEPARRAARRLVAAGRLEITQQGRVVDPSTAKGPVRLRRP